MSNELKSKPNRKYSLTNRVKICFYKYKITFEDGMLSFFWHCHMTKMAPHKDFDVGISVHVEWSSSICLAPNIEMDENFFEYSINLNI